MEYRSLAETMRDTALSMVESGWVKVRMREGESEPLKTR